MTVNATELLRQFRILGGVAENVCIRQGPHGYGVFAVIPKRPVRLMVPSKLLISPETLAFTSEGNLAVKNESGLSAGLAAFHAQYQRSFGWGAGGFERVKHYHQQMCDLPSALKNFLLILGCSNDLLSQMPTPVQAFKEHCISRQIAVSGTSKLMPVIELINYASDGAPYVVMPEGVSLSGTFENEVLARYRQSMDAFHFFFNYRFAASGRSTLSCEVTVDIPQFKPLRITRLDGLFDVKNGARWPRVSSNKDEIHLSFVELINLDAPTLPRQVFIDLLSAQGLAISRAGQLFDGLLDHNRQVLQDFLCACENAEGQVVESLKAVARYQMSNLSLV
jgi:hypothetical protein